MVLMGGLKDSAVHAVSTKSTEVQWQSKFRIGHSKLFLLKQDSDPDHQWCQLNGPIKQRAPDASLAIRRAPFRHIVTSVLLQTALRGAGSVIA